MIVRMMRFTIEQRILDPEYVPNVSDGVRIDAHGEAKQCIATCHFELNGVEVDGTFYLPPETQHILEDLLQRHIARQRES